jgi:16S rRNA (guanine527-N7)-methyltransferase
MTHAAAARQTLQQGLEALGLALPEAALDKLLAYQALIARWNKTYNLTAVRDPQDMLVQHLLDCLAIVRPLAAGAPAAASAGLRVLDVGSGAGLPGVVLAICQPTWYVSCVDTVAKKASFIRQAGLELGLPNLVALHQRVENLPAAGYDLITSRAFASLADFVTLSRTQLATGGCWAAMKAKLTPAETAAIPADVEVQEVLPLHVPGLDAERCLVWLRLR